MNRGVRNSGKQHKMFSNYIFILQLIKGTVKEKWKGVTDEPWESQVLKDKTSILCSCLEKLIYNCVKIIPKRAYARFCIKVVVLNKSYSTITQPIWKRIYPTGARESQICSDYHFYFAFCIFKSIIDNIVT